MQRLPTTLVAVLCVLFVAVLGLTSLQAPAQLDLGMLFVIPVVLTAATGRTAPSSALVVVSTATWTAVDLQRGTDAGRFVVGNAGLRLVVLFSLAAMVLALVGLLHSAATLSSVDELTGLPNRRAFYGRASTEIARMGRTGSPLSIAYLDVDHFKQINDVYGHEEGDMVLRKLASALMYRSRETDLVARLGGDEFTLLLPDTDTAGSESYICDLQATINTHVRVGGEPVGVSIGVVTYGHPPPSVDEFLQLADMAMYRAKRNNGPTWHAVGS